MSRAQHLALLRCGFLSLTFCLGASQSTAQNPDTAPPATTAPQPVPDPATPPAPSSPPAQTDQPAMPPETPAVSSAPAPAETAAPVVRVPPANAGSDPDVPPAPDEMSADDASGATDADAPADFGKASKKSEDKPKADKADKADTDEPLPSDRVHNPVMWHDPGNIAGKNLYYGVGGTKNMPRGPFTFLAEDKSGTNPKFDARDARGKKWRVKLGEEARPEVVASRLLWAVGYYANDDYNLASADISGLKISRGGIKGEHIEYARFERKPSGKSKIGTWKWKENPFLGTQEFDGLRVMMALMNNWDLKDVNNSVYADDGGTRQIFLVNDVGATFATNNLALSRSKDKGNVESFEKSKFITKTTPQTVSFGTPAPPTGVLVKTFGIMAKDYFRRSGFQWIGQDIPREHARWMAKMLGQLSTQQLHDAFRAGNFPPEQIDMYVMLVHNRILLLQEL